MRHVVLLLALAFSTRVAHAALPYCDAPPTELHRAICTTDDGNLTRRAERLVELAARYLKANPAHDRKLDAELRGFFSQTTKACLGKKKSQIPCVYDAFDRKLVALSTRLLGTKEGVAPGRYRYTQDKAVDGELVFLRDEDGGASLTLDTVVANGTNACFIVADDMQVSPDGFAWSAKEHPTCRVAVDVGSKSGQLTIRATAECESYFCGTGAIFTGAWTIRK